MKNVRVGASSDKIRTAAASDDSALRVGWAAVDAQRPDEAERVARAVLSGHPQHLGAMHLLGLALLIQKRPREAVGPLTEAARDSTDPLLETHYALAARDVGRKDEAITWLERAISRRPVFAPASTSLASSFAACAATTKPKLSSSKGSSWRHQCRISGRARRCLYLQRRAGSRCP
jgi:predicted Zn-dependent protease